MLRNTWVEVEFELQALRVTTLYIKKVSKILEIMFVVSKIRLSSTNICQDRTCALEQSNQYRLTSQVDESHSSLLKRQLLRVFWLWNVVPMLKIRVILEYLGEKA